MKTPKFASILILSAAFILASCGGESSVTPDVDSSASAEAESSISVEEDSPASNEEADSSDGVEDSSGEVDDGTFKNYKLAVQFGDEGQTLPDYVYAFAIGTFNGWENEKLTDAYRFAYDADLSAEEKPVYSAVIGNIAKDSALQWKVIMGTVDTMDVDEENGTYKVPWGHEGSVDGNNINLTVTSADPVVQVLQNYNFPANPVSEKYTVKLSVNFEGLDEVTVEDYTFQFKGSFDGWTAHDVSMDENGTINYTYYEVGEGSWKFGINILNADQEWFAWYGDQEIEVAGDIDQSYFAYFNGGNQSLDAGE